MVKSKDKATPMQHYQESGMIAESKAAAHAAINEYKDALALPLKEEALKGKIDLKYFGHAGFRISFKDEKDVQRAIYININADNADCPESDRKNPPNDADLICVTQG